MRSFRFFLFSICLTTAFTFSLNVEARFATRNDAAAEIVFFNRSIDVKSDGSYIENVEYRVKVLNESGRNNMASEPLLYDESSQKLKVKKAMTIDNGKEYLVDLKTAEDKQIASGAHGFSSYRQVLVSYPRVHVGSELYMNYVIENSAPYIPKVFSTNFVYGQEGYWVQSHVKVASEIPFEVKINDTEQALDVQNRKENGRQILEIFQKKPVIRQVVEEVGVSLDTKNFPWVSVSTINNWKELVDFVLPSYEKVLGEKLPDLFEEIFKKASAEKDLISKINRVTSELSAELHYMGDWRSISGRVYPNTLEQVAKTRRGDCKDFSSITVAILRKLGISASVAWVRRGGLYDPPVVLPAPELFNHAIVRVSDGNRTFWVDPTNSVSFSHGLFPDIADRFALPLAAGTTAREKIRRIEPNESRVSISETLKFLDKDSTEVKGVLEEKGVSAIDVTGATLNLSRENVDFHLINYLDDVNRVIRWKFKPYDLNSRIVKDVSFHYEYLRKDSELKTNAGKAHLVQHSFILGRYLGKTADRVSDLLVLREPSTLSRQTFLKEKVLGGGHPLSCRVDSRWAKGTLTVAQKANGIDIHEVFEVKQNLIPNAELQSGAFQKFQAKLEDCFNNVAIVFKQVENQAPYQKP